MSPKSLLPESDPVLWRSLYESGQFEAAYDLLLQPLHEALYQAQQFSLLDELSPGQRMLLCFDYIRAQVRQGGFIQFIQNGYVSLIVPVIEGLQHYQILPDLIRLLDDVLKIYVYNKEALDRETTVAEFSRMYQEYREFEPLDQQLTAMEETAIKEMLQLAVLHPDNFKDLPV